MYKIIGMLSQLEIAEMCARSGANCGSLFLDLRFRELMKTLLADHPVHLDSVSLANFMEHFSETEKLRYTGEEDDGEAHVLQFITGAIPGRRALVPSPTAGVGRLRACVWMSVSDWELTDKMFHFTCFNVEDPDDYAVGLVNGEVTIPGNLLRREVFDPVVNQVRLATSLVAGLMPASPSPCPFRPWRTLAYGTALPLTSIGVRANRSSDKEGRSTARRPPPRGRFLR